MSKLKTTNRLMDCLNNTWRTLHRMFAVGAEASVRGRRLAPLQELEDRCLLSVTPVGAESRVNTHTPGAQQTFPQTPHAVAMNPSTGDYVVAWSSQNQNGPGWNVYAQRYDAAGVAQGNEILVSTPAGAPSQQYASVAMSANGSFVITWSGNQAGNWNVYAQRFDTSGNAVGTPFQVSNPASGAQEFSTVAIDSVGNFVVTWSGQQSGNWDIYAQRYNSTGNALGSNFMVNSATAGDQEYSTIAMAPAGNFVVTWSGQQSGTWDVYAQMFASTGAPQGSEFRVNTTTANDQMFANLAINPSNGQFVITWSGDQAGHWNIYAQSYLASGTAAGSEFQVNPATSYDQEYSNVAYAGNNNPVFTWSSQNQDGSGWGVYLQQYNSAGNPLGSERLVNTYTQGDQFYSSIAGDQGGDLVVAWTSQNQDGSGMGVYAQRFVRGPAVSSAGISVSPASLQTSETGTSASFSVVLTSAPTANVTVNLSSTDATQGTLSSTSLTFTPGNWNVAQNVTVTGLDDHLVNGNQTYQINGTAASADANYSGLAMPAVTVVNKEADAAGFTVTPTSLTTSETGTSASFSVALTSQPLAPVTLNLGTSVAGQGAMSQSNLTFDASNWSIAQTVTVTGLDDHIVHGNQTYQITGTAASTDGVYNGMSMAPVTVTNTEADVAGFTVTPTSIQTSMAGAAASFSVVLTSQPVAPVTINLSSTNSAEGTLSQSSLTFNAGNWNVVQTVTVTGKNDPLASGDVTYQINGTASSTDANYSGLAMTPVTVTNVDTNLPGFIVGPTTLTTSETGTSASFTVALATNPLLPVTVNLTNGNPAQGTLSQTSLTFTLLNWNVPQSVTVTGLDDQIVNGNQTYQITGTATSLGTYNGLAITPVTITNTEADVAGFLRTPPSLTTSETGTSASFAVALTSKPTSAVTITLASTNPGQGSLSQRILTFNAGNWNVMQNVTVTGLDDQIVNGDQTYQITGNAASADGNYSGLAMTPVSVTNTEADAAGFTVTPTALTTSETGTSASFNVALTSQPIAPVTIAFSPTDANQGSLTQSSFTFDASNWNIGQTVTVTGLDDHRVNGNQTYQIAGSASSIDVNYAGLATTPVTVVNQEADVAGLTVTSTSLTTSETGTSASFAIALTSQPTAPVTVNLGTSVAGQGSLSQSSLTFDSSNWNVAQSVTVTGLDDHIVNGNQTYQVTGSTASADGNYSGLAMTPISVTNSEADVAGFTVTPTSLQTSESGSSASFRVAMTSQPVAPVTVNLSMSMAGQGSLSQSSLTFDASNWNVPQSVTVTGLDDLMVNGDQTYQINGNAVSADGNYNGLTTTPVTVVNKEIGTAGFLVNPTALTTSENGTSATFTVALNSLPLLPVTLNLTSTNPAQGSLSQTSMTFDATNWNVPQSVTVTGLDDYVVNGTQTYQINGTGASADPLYNNLAMSAVTVVNQETDVARIAVTPTSLTTAETGTSASFGVTLTSQPIAPVTINLGMSVAGQGSLSQTSLAFDSSNWNIAQNVTVTGLDDHIANGNQTYQITGSATSTDGNYSGMTMTPISVTNTEADFVGINVTPGSLTTAETGTSASFGVTLTSQPIAPVTINLGMSVAGQGSLSQASLTFDSTNWNITQNVTITGLDDQIVNGNQTYQITGSTTSTDANYGGLTMTPVSVTNVEADVAGISVTPTAGLVTTPGGSAQFNIVLTSQPTANVTIPLTTSNPLAGNPTQPSVTFTAADWNTPQTVTVTSPSGPGAPGDVSYTIHVGPAVSADGTYNARSGNDVALTLHVGPAAPVPVPPPSATLPPFISPGVLIPPPTPAPNPSAGFSTPPAASPAPMSPPSVGTISLAGATALITRGNDVAMDTTLTASLAQAVSATSRTIQVFAPIPQTAWMESQVLSPATLPTEPPMDGVVSRSFASQGAPLQMRTAQGDDVLDVLTEDGERIPWTEAGPETTLLVGTGIIAASGYVLLNSRIGLWLLGLLTSQPLWKQFDPLEVLYAWEDDDEDRAKEEQDEETLMSLVD